jgi:hypothetical protein
VGRPDISQDLMISQRGGLRYLRVRRYHSGVAGDISETGDITAGRPEILWSLEISQRGGLRYHRDWRYCIVVGRSEISQSLEISQQGRPEISQSLEISQRKLSKYLFIAACRKII